MSAEDDMAWPAGTTVIPADPPSPLTCPECGASVICTNEPSKHAAAVTALASSPAPAGLDVAMSLLNSLGIVGPNIIHAEQGMWPDGKHSEDNTWDGPGWCVCRREWPCEAKRLGEVVAALASSPAPAGLDTPDCQCPTCERLRAATRPAEDAGA